MASAFDPSCHLTPNDVTISKKVMKIALKWTKTIQSSDNIHGVFLPSLQGSILCPVAALQKAIFLYKPSTHASLFQIKSNASWRVLIDSYIRKVLLKLNTLLGLKHNHFMFHTFRHSGAICVQCSNAYTEHQASWLLDVVLCVDVYSIRGLI